MALTRSNPHAERFVLPFSVAGNVARTAVQQGPYRPLRFSGDHRDGALLLRQIRINGRNMMLDDRGVTWSTFITPYEPELRLDVLRFQDVVELEFSGPPTRVDLICGPAAD
jgi:hypothetical protein